MTRRAQVPGIAAVLAAGAAVSFFAGRDFETMRDVEAVFPSEGLTARKALSDYFPPLKGTPGDTDVFVFDSGAAGGNIFIAGGTHPNEPAGLVSAVVLAENIRPTRGKIIIVPRANASGFTHCDPQEGAPQRYALEARGGGRREFRLGSRVTNPVHQWPDPLLYINPGGQKLAGIEARNLNRAYPGKRGGNLTERVAFGIMELLRAEKIDLGIDLHESAPEYPVINAIVFHDSAAEVAATAQLALQAEGIEVRLEASPANLRGLSHREWGDAAGIKAVLIETPSASHGRLKGRPSAALIVDGRDRYYVKAARLGRLFVAYGPEGIPLRERVARHVAGVRAVLAALGDLEPAKAVAIDGFPDPARILSAGLSPFLKPGT